MNRFAIVDAEAAHFCKARMCRLLSISRSSYYAWKKRKPSMRQRSEERLVVKMKAIHARTYRCYGSPRMTAELHSNGEKVGRHRVARLMRKHGLLVRKKKRFVATTQSNHGRAVSDNMLKRNFHVAIPNQVWVGDITYLRTRQGFGYLSVIVDLYARAVVGGSLDSTLQTSGALGALRYAIGARAPKPGLIHHSDRGSQYASEEYRKVLKDNGLTSSMSRRGDCWDNAVAESFFASLKKERIQNQIFDSIHDARCAIAKYIDGFYNPRRLHKHNGQQSPFDKEFAYAIKQRLRDVA